MNCHQILSGAVNSGDNCYSVGSVEGVPFTAYTAGCNIVVLASNFERVQIIPGILYGNIQVNCLDCSTDVGKIGASYGKKICIFEPTPLLHQTSSHKLDYKWIQTAALETDCFVSVISWNLEGTKLLTGGTLIQMWHLISLSDDEIMIKTNDDNRPSKVSNENEIDRMRWDCVWQCRTASPVSFLRFSPDGTIFTSAGKADRLVKIWFESAAKNNYFGQSMIDKLSTNNVAISQQQQNDVNYSFVYIAHPRAVTGISWRKTSKYLSRGSVANMLVTSCRDNICRLWIQTLLPDDGLVNFTQIEGLTNHTVPRTQTQHHRQKIMQRIRKLKLRHYTKRQEMSAHEDYNDANETIPNLPSTYSVHDFHSFGIHGSAMVPGFHFHLAASINAETDIPLVPSLNGAGIQNDAKNNPSFVIHWLNNKEMAFTQSAERMLHTISRKIIQSEMTRATSAHSNVGSDTGEGDGETDETDAASTLTVESKKKTALKNGTSAFRLKKLKRHGKGSTDEPENDDTHQPSRQSVHTTSSSTSLATEINAINNMSQTRIGDAIDRKLEALVREWHSNSDLLFSIHPVDGSLLVWLVEWLDETSPGSFRQAQVSFSSRIPNAIPLGDAATMSHNIALYSPHIYFDIKSAFLTPSSSSANSDIQEKANVYQFPKRDHMSLPTVCLLTKHHNGSLNLWILGFGEGSHYTQVLSISHSARVCGHRFRVNDITCHPVLPLLVTTSHHNVSGTNNKMFPKSPGSSISTSPAVTPTSVSCCSSLHGTGLPNTGFCSELILWRVDTVGPLSKSGGITELARINSPETAAFSNVAWIPTLLPSTTLGAVSNSPSACFVASDGHQLRIYQAVIDARTLLAEVSNSERKNQRAQLSPLASDDSTSSETGVYRHNLKDAFKIVSLQSTSRPGCILELNCITDAVHDWQNTQLLHVFQEQLIRGDSEGAYMSWDEKQRRNTGLVESSLGAVVDLRHSAVFSEPFYLVVVEKNLEGLSVLHMWRLLIASQSHTDESKMSYVPDSHIIQESDHSNASSPSNTPDAHDKEWKTHDKANQFHPSHLSPILITTTKVCTQILPLPNDVEVIHASPAAGHLSSSNIYPACFAPYLICTACSDGNIRFWRCKTTNDGTGSEYIDENESLQYTWFEWEMMINKEKSSAIQLNGMPLYVSCAYNGRIACAYKYGQSFTRPTSKDPNSRFININLAIYECESTGGEEWILEDTINLKNIALPQSGLNMGIDLAPLVDTTLRNRKTVDTLVMKMSSGNEDHVIEHRGTTNIERLLSVPSYTTMQSLKRIITEQGNQFTLTQKSLVQLDWVSTEDGSHVLTVSAGSKITLFTPVSTDIAQANLQAMKTSEKTMSTSSNRMLLKQASSMAAPLSGTDDIRWMMLRTTNLTTSDGLSPLPMQMSWVRDGILVVGMDNEMHIYTQWKSEKIANSTESVEITDVRTLTEQGLLSRVQESSHIHLLLPSHAGSMPRSPSANVLISGTTVGETKRSQTGQSAHNQNNQQESDNKVNSLSHLPDFGIFEASRLACPVLPQYHPKQLMELLAFGKIHRVRAILGHLVSCLCSMNSFKNCLQQNPDYGRTFESRNDSERSPRSWRRSRAFSVAAPQTSPGQQMSPLDSDNLPFITEEVQLDYTEITSIRPLPLFTLIEADNEKLGGDKMKNRENALENALGYDNLFDTNFKTQVEETLDQILGRSAFNFNVKPKKTSNNEKNSNFGPRQARLLTKLLTHSHLPGLSSLDQMHLLALADSVASFNPTADKSTAEGDESGNANVIIDDQIVSADSLDDCGLRFLLTMRQHIYLLRCLPLMQRKMLQKEGLGYQNIVWAFHSETQEELVQLIPSVQRGNTKWSELRELGMGWWVRNNVTLRKVIEKLAKAAFQEKHDPLDAALFYLAMKKKSLVWGLFRSIHEKRMTEFFEKNFNEEKWRKAALKNAYALLGKQRFEHAAAFFLLAGSVWDAIEVCLTKLEDLQLAMVIVRLYDGDIETVPENLKRLLYREILGVKPDGSGYMANAAHPDPFLRSMSYWMLQDYNRALSTLLEVDIGTSHPKYCHDSDVTDLSINPSVFNFYLYLRTQPLIVRRQFAQTIQEKKEKTQYSTGKLIHETSYSGDAITPFERRLFFITAHAHFRAGCPSLALEVLSRLPNRIVMDEQKQMMNGNVSNVNSFTPKGSLPNGDVKTSESIDWSTPIVSQKNTTDLFDWGAPITSLDPVDTSDFQMSVEPCSDDEDADTGGLQMKTSTPDADQSSNNNKEIKLDIMAQQLKFIACLKILMEELSTLATGFEVDGGQLRYHLYVWLEKSVQSLKSICNYRTFSMRYVSHEPESSSMAMDHPIELTSSDRNTPRGSHSDTSDCKPTLHEILLADKLDFEAKLDRSSRRKLWLTANEALLRTLLSYCSLHGAHGGGLSSVRMELVLLLQELQQERTQRQLLSPLPFPTTLPLLAASVACQKTVVADPIRHLQLVTHDILQTLVDLKSIPLTLTPNYSLVYVMRDLSMSLAACIYQSLCDSDTVTTDKPGMIKDNLTSVVCQNTHLLAGHHQEIRRNLSNTYESNDTLIPTTAPNKWPGVQSLRALLARDKDEDSPKLHTLLCEAFVSVYLSQLIYASAACDSHVLYRLIGLDFNEQNWAQLFGGGAKKLIHVSTSTIGQTVQQQQQQQQLQQQQQQLQTEESESTSLDLFNRLNRERMKFHMKILQLNQGNQPIPPPNITEDRPTYREQFVPPQMSMISFLMTKPKLPDEYSILDYDSSESIESENDDIDNYEEDFAATESVFAESTAVHHGSTAPEDKNLERENYAWGIMRYAIVKLVRFHMIHFLQVAGIELIDLPTTSPLIHAVLKVMDSWQNSMKDYVSDFGGPPIHFLPNSYVESNRQGGPAILKYKSLLELTNTPFITRNATTKGSKRLWNYLVRQERVQDIFIRYIFGKPKSLIQTKIDSLDNEDNAGSERIDSNPEPIRIVHKDQDNISAFCINRANPGLVAIATPKEIQELNISVLLEPVPWFEEEAEYDILNLLKAPESLPFTDYLVVQHPSDRLHTSPGGIAIESSASAANVQTANTPQSAAKSTIMAKHHFPGNTIPQFCQYVIERSRHIFQPLKRHKTEGVRRLCSHPTLPLYISGSQDGSVILWEWNHQQPIAIPRPAGTFAKVTRVGFNQQGNKFGVTDSDGNLSLWQVALSSAGSKPFFSMQCHSRQVSDFTFLGSSSLVITAGLSNDHKNVALWDTLLPTKKCLVTSFSCHEQHGSSAILYAPINQLLITGGKKGDVYIFDMRLHTQRHKFVAHESAIKCMALDPGEEFFATGSADGDIKVWGLGSVCVPFYSFPGEHSRSTLFRNIGMGVSHLYIDQNGRLFSCGADGSMKLRQLPDRDTNILNTF